MASSPSQFLVPCIVKRGFYHRNKKSKKKVINTILKILNKNDYFACCFVLISSVLLNILCLWMRFASKEYAPIPPPPPPKKKGGGGGGRPSLFKSFIFFRCCLFCLLNKDLFNGILFVWKSSLWQCNPLNLYFCCCV